MKPSSPVGAGVSPSEANERAISEGEWRETEAELAALAAWMNAIDACTGDPVCAAEVHTDDCRCARAD